MLTIPQWLSSSGVIAGAGKAPVVGICEGEGSRAYDVLAALRLALEDAGQSVHLHVADDRCCPDDALAAARRLVAAGAQFVIGHFDRAAARAASRVYSRAGTVFIAPGTPETRLCGRDSSTTIQLFGTDDEQVECLAGAGAPAAATTIVAQAGSHAMHLGRELFHRLTRTHRRLKVLCLSAEQISACAGQMAGHDRIFVIGSQDFAGAVCHVPGVATGKGPIFLSEASFAAGRETLGPPIERCRVAFLEQRDYVVIDRPAAALRSRAMLLLGRAAGASFEMSYLAVRALTAAWNNPGIADPTAVRQSLLRKAWRSPYGVLRLTPAGRLSGHRWSMVPAGLLEPRVPQADRKTARSGSVLRLAS